MTLTIAIQPDETRSSGVPDSSSPRWAAAIERAGHRVRPVNVFCADILEQIEGCQGFMWRFSHLGSTLLVARRLMPVLERELGLAVYPDQHTCWHYDDKIAQAYLLKALQIPTPTTWVWFDLVAAKAWAQQAAFPMVAKLAGGAGSSNVRLLRSPKDAVQWIDRMFGPGISTAGDVPGTSFPVRLRNAAKMVLGRNTLPFELQKNYVLFQEFLADNPFDTRITVIGSRAFGFRRFNRPDDFRASGSGLIDHDPQFVDPRFVRLAYQTAAALRSQSCAIDGLWRNGEPTVGEVSFVYSSKAVYGCPGHWELNGDPRTGELTWIEGSQWPEEAQAEDFLRRVADCHAAPAGAK